MPEAVLTVPLLQAVITNAIAKRQARTRESCQIPFGIWCFTSLLIFPPNLFGIVPRGQGRSTGTATELKGAIGALTYNSVVLLYPVVSRSSRANGDVVLVHIYGLDCPIGRTILLSVQSYFQAGQNRAHIGNCDKSF